MKNWQSNLNHFITLATKYNVRMLMVGGTAVQYYGYNRNSLDVDFWVDTSQENLERLLQVFRDMECEINDFPEKVKTGGQNISIKFAPIDLDLELITNFSVNKTFDQAYEDAEEFILAETPRKIYKVLSLNDLIISKVKYGRPKDLLDIQELNRIHKLK